MPFIDNPTTQEHTHIIRGLKSQEDMSTRVIRILHPEEQDKVLEVQNFFPHALVKGSNQGRSPFMTQEQFNQRFVDLFIPANLGFHKRKEDTFVPAFPDFIEEPHVFTQKTKRGIRGFAYIPGL